MIQSVKTLILSLSAYNLLLLWNRCYSNVLCLEDDHYTFNIDRAFV